ncbi:MAG: sigma-70 family RNA polymerase sigma factor [Gemmataceae bacterium]
MPTGQMSDFLQRLRSTVLLRYGAGRSDGQLLDDYVNRRDEAALADLVRRHGPMVWGVCRRILRNYHHAEDAFQATFLVLVRRAASIASRELLANWLYGVAHQTALKARSLAVRRGTRERQATPMPEPAVEEQGRVPDLEPLLDRELSRLPEKYRAVIVLCHLEGMTRKQAARRLGVPEGTIASRLTTARTMLTKRLARHGPAASSLAPALLSRNAASAAVPAGVVSGTIKAATLVAAGEATLSAHVVALVEGVLKAMLLNKVKTSALLVVAPILLILTYAALGQGQSGDKVDAEKRAAPVAAGAEEKKEKPLAPQTIFDKQFEGRATVEFLAGEVHTLNIDSVFVPNVSHAQIISAKVPGAKAGQEFIVCVVREVATRLLRLGIADPAEHFRGKVLRVSGVVQRLSGERYRLYVTSLEQLEIIRNP